MTPPPALTEGERKAATHYAAYEHPPAWKLSPDIVGKLLARSDALARAEEAANSVNARLLVAEHGKEVNERAIDTLCRERDALSERVKRMEEAILTDMAEGLCAEGHEAAAELVESQRFYKRWLRRKEAARPPAASPTPGESQEPVTGGVDMSNSIPGVAGPAKLARDSNPSPPYPTGQKKRESE